MPQWSDPGDGKARRTTIDERGEILVDLLQLSDALPPTRRSRELDAPTFKELCARK